MLGSWEGTSAGAVVHTQALCPVNTSRSQGLPTAVHARGLPAPQRGGGHARARAGHMHPQPAWMLLHAPFIIPPPHNTASQAHCTRLRPESGWMPASACPRVRTRASCGSAAALSPLQAVHRLCSVTSPCCPGSRPVPPLHFHAAATVWACCSFRGLGRVLFAGHGTQHVAQHALGMPSPSRTLLPGCGCGGHPEPPRGPWVVLGRDDGAPFRTRLYE
jgi:hypothetical protein